MDTKLETALRVGGGETGRRLSETVEGLSDRSPALLLLVVLSNLFPFFAAVTSVLLGAGPSLSTRTHMIVLVTGHLVTFVLLVAGAGNARDRVLVLRGPRLESFVAVPVGLVAIIGITRLLDPAGTGGIAESTALASGSPLFQFQFFVVLVVVLPLMEEILYRGLLFGYVLDRYQSVAIAIAVTVAAFGLAHFEYGVAGVVARAAASTVYVAQRIRYGSLTEPFLTHAAFNAVVFAGLVGVY